MIELNDKQKKIIYLQMKLWLIGMVIAGGTFYLDDIYGINIVKLIIPFGFLLFIVVSILSIKCYIARDKDE